MKRAWTGRLVFLGSVALLVGCDHASKLAAEAALRDHDAIPLVRGLLDLSYTENRDIAFNALSRLSWHVPAGGLAALAVLVTAGLLVAWLRRRRAGWAEHAGLALVCAGALGNGLDRLTRGHVIDFIHLHAWPVFNVADVLIVVGVILLAFGRRQVPSASPRPTSS